MVLTAPVCLQYHVYERAAPCYTHVAQCQCPFGFYYDFWQYGNSWLLALLDLCKLPSVFDIVYVDASDLFQHDVYCSTWQINENKM